MYDTAIESTTCKAIMGEVEPIGSVKFNGDELAGKKAFDIAKINFREHCFFDLVPHDYLVSFLHVKIRSPRIGEPHLDRVDVSWSDGSFGKNLYPQTLEVISAS